MGYNKGYNKQLQNLNYLPQWSSFLTYFTVWCDLWNPRPHADSRLGLYAFVVLRLSCLFSSASYEKKRILGRYIRYLTTWLRSPHIIPPARTIHKDQLRYKGAHKCSFSLKYRTWRQRTWRTWRTKLRLSLCIDQSF